jgi:hypothetical protein
MVACITTHTQCESTSLFGCIGDATQIHTLLGIEVTSSRLVQWRTIAAEALVRKALLDVVINAAVEADIELVAVPVRVGAYKQRLNQPMHACWLIRCGCAHIPLA